MNKYNIFIKILLDRISKPSVGIDDSVFSKNIVRKYGIFRNSGRLPSLIFLRLFGNRSVNKKINLNNKIFINNSIKSFYIQYPEVFRQYCSYFPIVDQNISRKTANISMFKQGGIVNNIIKNTISHEHITNKYYETGDYRSFPILTATVGASEISLYSINHIANNYLQRFINIRNTGHKFNKQIYPEIQYFANEDQFFKLLQIIKKNRSIADKNISQETADISIPKQGGIVNTNINNTISHEHITNRYYEAGDARSFPISSTTIRAPGITVNSINPIVSNYLQRFINIIKTGSKFNKPIYPEIQYFTNEKHLFRLVQLIKKNKSIAEKNITQVSGITVNSINPIVSNYLQRFINIIKTGFKFNKQTYPEIQYFTNEKHFFRLLQIIKKNRSIADKNTSQETANISISKQGRIVNNNNINNTIPHEYITNKYYETGDDISFPISSTTVRASGITVNSINPIVSNYLQRFISIKNTGPEFNKPIYPEIQYFTNENYLFELLQTIKKNRLSIYKNIPQTTVNISIEKQSGIINNNNIYGTIPHEYITNKYYETGDDISFPISSTTVRASGITVNSINPIVSNYLQRFINIINTGPTFNKSIYPEMQYFANENHLFRLLQIIEKNRSIEDKNISQETTNISIAKQGRIVNNNNINNTIPYEHITNKHYETEDDISFSISSTTIGASGITVNSINPIVSNYLQRFINIMNTAPTFNKPIYPEIRYFTNENHLFRLLQIVKKNRSIVDNNISQETANISNSQQSRIINNTRLYNHIIKKSSNAIKYFQEISNINNIGSRVIHPLIIGLHPSFNEEDLINKNNFPIQDVDLTYASDPVLNMPTSQNADIDQEKIENIPVRSVNSTGINENLIKESSPHRPVHEIYMIADKVYKIIEKKISIEKDRRGLF